MNEKQILQIILAGGSSAEYLLNKLNTNDFFDPRVKLIFQIFQEVYRRKNVVMGKEALLLLLSTLPNDLLLAKESIPYVTQLTPVYVSVSELEIFIIDVIKKRLREIVNNTNDLDEMFVQMQKVASAFANNYKVLQFDQIQEEDKEKIQSPWESLNSVLPDSFKRGDLCLLLAGVNVGKTMFLCNLLKSPHFKDKRVKYVVCEDGPVRIRNRLFKIFADPIKFFKEYNIDFQLVDSPTPQLSTIRELAAQSDVLIIDYLDRIQTQITEYRFMLRYISQSLKNIAEEQNCLIWTAKQIRREGLTKQVVSMVDIGESFAVCESPDLIIGMSIQEGQCYLNITKSRDVRYSDLVILNCDVKEQRIYE